MSGAGKIVAATVVVAAGALVFWAVSTVPQAPPPVKTDDSPRVMSYEDNVISEEKDGKKVWDLTAKTTKVDVDTQDAEMSDITGHYYGKDGQTVTLKADRGTYGKESKIVRLEGNIEATTTDGIKLTSAKLIWNGDEEILSAEENAVLMTKYF
mgnify:CR=1 FL=1